MRKHFQKTLSTMFAVGLLGCAVMLSVSSAEGPYRHAGQNAFNGAPLGHPDRALIHTQWLAECDVAPAPADHTAFDWKLDDCDACPKCGFKDSHVTPVVLDVPELMGPSDASAIEVIKRKLGINAFRGSIFEAPDCSAAQLFSNAACTAIDAVCGHDSCSAFGVCSAESEQCDKTCDTGACAAQTKVTVGVAAASSPSAPRDQAFAKMIEEDPVAALRRASLDLDEAAMKLEVSDRYAEADALREAAQHLRIKARQFKVGQSVSATNHTNASAVQATWYAPAAYCPESFIYPAPSSQNSAPYYFQSPSGIQPLE